MRRIAGLFFLIMMILGISSCFKNTGYEENEDERMRDFLKKNDFDAEPTESGMYYIEIVKGTGEQPVAGDTVEVYYIGMFLDERVFDTNLSGDPYSFVVGSGTVIEGWDEGIQYMKEGGEAMFVLPSWLAYGSMGTYGIPGYTPIVFEVILEKVIPGLNHQ